MFKIENYIGGKLVQPVSDEYFDNFNPATGEVYSLIPDSDERDVKRRSKRRKRLFPSGRK